MRASRAKVLIDAGRGAVPAAGIPRAAADAERPRCRADGRSGAAPRRRWRRWALTLAAGAAERFAEARSLHADDAPRPAAPPWGRCRAPAAASARHATTTPRPAAPATAAPDAAAARDRAVGDVYHGLAEPGLGRRRRRRPARAATDKLRLAARGLPRRAERAAPRRAGPRAARARPRSRPPATRDAWRREPRRRGAASRAGGAGARRQRYEREAFDELEAGARRRAEERRAAAGRDDGDHLRRYGICGDDKVRRRC
ncbi:hypothetical protein JL721_11327 [Aureococcus anophagefferens]|nr:hypothetical protein JL721_11327 [Aureococcus anophagefferens]